MSDNEEQRITLARTASEDEIMLYIHDLSPKVIRALIDNTNLQEEHALILCNRKNIPGDILDTIYRDKRWADSYSVRLALARNPKTPLSTAISIARFLRLFDLADIARNSILPVLYRKKIEALVIEKIPTLAMGIKKTLAKIAADEILLSLIYDGYPDVVKICLDNPHLVEAHLYKVINKKTTKSATIRAIAEHKNWSCRYNIRFALVRNEHTPLAKSVIFLRGLKTTDLKQLFCDPQLPPGIRPSLHKELMERGENPDFLKYSAEEDIIEIEENEMKELEQEIEKCDETGDKMPFLNNIAEDTTPHFSEDD